MFDPWVEKIPWGGHGNPLQYSCLENPHGQRSLVGYSPRGFKESDTTEWLSIDYVKSGNPRVGIQLPKTGFIPGLIFKNSFHFPLKFMDNCHSWILLFLSCRFPFFFSFLCAQFIKKQTQPVQPSTLLRKTYSFSFLSFDSSHSFLFLIRFIV